MHGGIPDKFNRSKLPLTQILDVLKPGHINKPHILLIGGNQLNRLLLTLPFSGYICQKPVQPLKAQTRIIPLLLLNQINLRALLICFPLLLVKDHLTLFETVNPPLKANDQPRAGNARPYPSRVSLKRQVNSIKRVLVVGLEYRGLF